MFACGKYENHIFSCTSIFFMFHIRILKFLGITIDIDISSYASMCISIHFRIK